MSKAEKEKIISPGLKRTLSEGNENNEPATKRELKRAKVEREELEAELELKITAKAGTHHKLEKVCHHVYKELSTTVKIQYNRTDDHLFILSNVFNSQIVQQLVDKQLRALQVTIFDKHFKELKDRVDRIDCSVKHQPAINALQVSSRHTDRNFY